ncbi:MAG: DUF2279 domain-containing protein [Flammeovirgaceae bacterium]
MKLKYTLLFLLFWGISSHSAAQKITTIASDSITYNPKRMRIVLGTVGTGYAVTMVGLGSIWYSDFERSSFHFFNDNAGWEYMDKLGHFTTAYYVGRAGIQAMRWTGVDDKKAIWYGGNIGLAFLTSVEIFDGFSADWGFSIGDVIANTTGSGLAIGQELLWKEQRITMKWSYRDSPYAQWRPNQLGASINERWLKDYNGQTYWISTNINSFIKKKSKLPDWLNIAVGYGANGMLGAVNNPTADDDGNPIPHFERYKQWYISPDIDLTRIKTNSKFLKVLLQGIGFLKVPMPTLEYNRVNRFRFHWLFF